MWLVFKLNESEVDEDQKSCGCVEGKEESESRLRVLLCLRFVLTFFTLAALTVLVGKFLD